MNQFEAMHLLGRPITFLTRHGEIIHGKLQSHASDNACIIDGDGNTHIYPWYWIDVGENVSSVVLGTPYNIYGRTSRKLIIIGAGASYDFSTGSNREFTPPLSNDIFGIDHFDILDSYYPRIQESLNDLAVQDNLERRLLRIFERAKLSHSMSSANLLMEMNYYLAQIFLLYSLKNRKEYRSNYLSLLTYILEYLEDHRDEEVVIINFNYDTILDNAIEKTHGMFYSNPNDYLGTENLRIKMFKVHGSCNWVRKFRAISKNEHYIDKRSFSHNSLVDELSRREMHLGIVQNYLEDKIEILDYNKLKLIDFTLRLDVGPFFPHLLIPMNDKDEFMIPSNQVGAMESALGSVNEIVTIGWKGEEKALQRMFMKCNAPLKKITVVDFASTNSIIDIEKFPFQNEQRLRFGINPTIFSSGFSGYTRGLSNSEFTLFDSNLR
jgi:hypothetical protein